MTRSVKKIVIFVAFIVILFLFSLTKFFTRDLLWPNEEMREFNGIIFANPTNIESFNVSRSVENIENKDYIKYDLSFSYNGEDSTARILGTPTRHIFFGEEVDSSNSKAVLKGDFDKLNHYLLNEKLKLKDFYKKVKKSDFVANSYVKIPVNSKVSDYKFSIYYDPTTLYFSGKKPVEEASIFVTNAKVENWVDNTKRAGSIKEAINNSGYYINRLEIINESLVSRISVINTISTILFIAMALVLALFIWLNKENFIFYLIPMLVMIPTFYRFIDKGTSTLGILIIYPILAFIASLGAKVMTNEKNSLAIKDLKQSLAFTILYFVISLIIFIIPRAI